MDLPLTLSITAAFFALAVFSGWRGSLPPNLLKGPRMIPWRLVMVSTAALGMLMLVHAATLLGLHHDRY